MCAVGGGQVFFPDTYLGMPIRKELFYRTFPHSEIDVFRKRPGSSSDCYGVQFRFHNANDVAMQIQQRAAAISRLDGCAYLNQSLVVSDAGFRGNDPG